MKAEYYIEEMDKPLERHTIESLVHAANLEMGDLEDNDAITLGQYRELEERWDDFRCKCKTELMRRVKEMLHKFARHGKPGLMAMQDLNDLANVTIETEKGIDNIFKGWDRYSFSTQDLWGRNLKNLNVYMAEYVRGEYDECTYNFPLEFLRDDFEPMTNERAKKKILTYQTKYGYSNAIPTNPTMEQMNRFLDEYNKDENFKAKIDAIFAKDDNHE